MSLNALISTNGSFLIYRFCHLISDLWFNGNEDGVLHEPESGVEDDAGHLEHRVFPHSNTLQPQVNKVKNIHHFET